MNLVSRERLDNTAFRSDVPPRVVLEGPDTVRMLATRHGILIGDCSVHAAGPMRGHGQSRLSDTCSDLRRPGWTMCELPSAA
jgi:hypothetical protein